MHLCVGTGGATATSLGLYYKMYYKDVQLGAVATREGRTLGTVRGCRPAAMRGVSPARWGLPPRAEEVPLIPSALYYKLYYKVTVFRP